MAMCKSCGAYITFGTTKNGKLMPLNNDGTPHLATCSNPNVYRKRKPVKKELVPELDFELDSEY